MRKSEISDVPLDGPAPQSRVPLASRFLALGDHFPPMRARLTGNLRYVQTLAVERIRVKNRGNGWKLALAIRLTADANLAEAQEDTPAIHRPAEIHLRPKAREHEELVDLMMDVGAFRAGKDFVIDHFSLGVQRRFQ